MLSSFYLNSHNRGFQPQRQKLTLPLYSTINGTIGKYCSVAFIWILATEDFSRRGKSWLYLVQYNKRHHRKVLLSSFHLNSSQPRVSAAGAKVDSTLYSTINGTIGKYCSVAFIWILATEDFSRRGKSWLYLVQYMKMHHRKVLLSSFHLNSHTPGFQPQKEKLALCCSGCCNFSKTIPCSTLS